MIEKNFIDEIVTEVYKRLEQYSYHRKRVGIIGPVAHNLIHNIGHQYVVVEESMDCDIFIITEMSYAMLARLALGLPGSQNEELILSSLLLGKKVFLLQQGIEFEQYKDTSYKNLYLLYQDYLSKLMLFGIQIINHVSMIETSISDTVDKQKVNDRARYDVVKDLSCNESCMDLSMKNVLLEKDLKNYHLHNNSTIILDKKCIITPLAEDYLKMHMISVQKK